MRERTAARRFGIPVPAIETRETIAEGVAIGLVRSGDIIVIDIPNRVINLRISDDELTQRRVDEDAKGADAWQPGPRDRNVTAALRAYAAMATSADRGAVRDVDQLSR